MKKNVYIRTYIILLYGNCVMGMDKQSIINNKIEMNK